MLHCEAGEKATNFRSTRFVLGPAADERLELGKLGISFTMSWMWRKVRL
jgi:hypothetical protein